MHPLPPVTKAFMLLCVGLFCFFELLGPGPSSVFQLWPLQSGRFLPWQPISYAFLHGDLTHLFLNMLGLAMVGAELERTVGRKHYLQLLLASTLTAAATQLIFKGAMGSMGPTVGASGAVFGLLLAFGTRFPNRMVMLLIPPIPMKVKYLVAIFGGLELLMGLFSPMGGVAHFAHLGGMLGAWLLIIYWRRTTGRR